MSKILILAAAGMAGHVVASILEKNKDLEILKTSRCGESITESNTVHLELKDQDKLNTVINNFAPDYIISCAGILVNSSDNNPAEAIYINSYLPQYLNKLSETLGFKLIHISTDCVFSGSKGQYTEQDTPDATNAYGRTKTLGEIDNNKNLTIRTSIIGPELKPNGTGLMHWFFNQSGDIKGFTKAIWSGVTTLELAKFIVHIIKLELDTNNSFNLTNIYHLTNNSSINKYDLLNLIKTQFKISHINIQPDDNYNANKSFISTRDIKNLNYSVPSYADMITELYNHMAAHKDLYSQYKLFD